MASIADMRQALAEAEAAFALHPDVTLIGIGEKHTGSENARSYAIIFYVESKGEPRGILIPKMAELPSGVFPTDVQELPRTDIRQTNAQLDGADVVIDASGRFGTLGFIAKEDGGLGRMFGITNAHVVAPTRQSAVGQSVSANLNGTRVVIGQVSHQVVLFDDGRTNKPDVALIELNTTGVNFARKYQIEAWPTQPIDGVDSLSAAPQAGNRLLHEYASKAVGGLRVVGGVSPNEVRRLPVRAKDTGGIIWFPRAFHLRVSPNIRSGHSGSALTRLRANGRGRALAGLVFGGSGSNMFAFAWRDVAQVIKSDFRIDL